MFWQYTLFISYKKSTMFKIINFFRATRDLPSIFSDIEILRYWRQARIQGEGGAGGANEPPEKYRIVGKIIFFWTSLVTLGFSWEKYRFCRNFTFYCRIFVGKLHFSELLLLIVALLSENKTMSQFAPPSTNCWIHACQTVSKPWREKFSAPCKNHKMFPLGMTILLRVVYLINAVCVCLITAKNISATLIWSLCIRYGAVQPNVKRIFKKFWAWKLIL